jgi:hypothetical protein
MFRTNTFQQVHRKRDIEEKQESTNVVAVGITD